MKPRDYVVNFGSVRMPDGYRVVWSDGNEMYFWVRDSDDHWDGPYCNRFDARRSAVHDSKL